MILHTTSEPENGANHSETSGKSRSDRETAPSLVVRGKISGLKKRSAPHPEIAIVAAATSYLEQHFPKEAVFVTVEAHDQDERTARALIRKVKSDICQLQARAGLPKYCIEVLEAKHSVHSHLIAVLPFEDAKRLENYSYGGNITRRGIRAVTDMSGLTDYLLKEIVKPSPKPLGEGGGDRVRLSKALRAELVAAGLIPADVKSTYASRSLKPLKPVVPMAAVVEAAVASPPQPVSQAPAPSDPKQVELFPDLPPRVDLFALLEATRRAMRLPQRAVASDIGITQGHYANSLRGHDGLGKDARRNALEWLSRHGFPRPPEGPPPARSFLENTRPLSR